MARPRMIVVAGLREAAKRGAFRSTRSASTGSTSMTAVLRSSAATERSHAMCAGRWRKSASGSSSTTLSERDLLRSKLPFARPRQSTKQGSHNGADLSRTCISWQRTRLLRTLRACSSVRRQVATAHPNERSVQSITPASRILPRRSTRSTVFASTTRRLGGRRPGSSRSHARVRSFVTGLRPGGSRVFLGGGEPLPTRRCMASRAND